MTQDRQPPYSIESEQSVLGSLMLRNEVFDDIADILAPEDFHRADHQLIWSGICAMLNSGKPCDIVTLTEWLKERGQLEDAGGVRYLAELDQNTPSAANVRLYAQIVAERSVMRTLIAAGGDVSELGFRPNGRSTNELIDLAQSRLLSIGARNPQEGPQLAGGYLAEYSNDLHSRADRRRGGLTTGFSALDDLTGGLEGGDFVVLAARPSMGKTALALNIAEHACADGAVAIFSAEMPRKQVIDRLVAARHQVPLQALRRPWELTEIDFDSVTDALKDIGKMPLLIDDSSSPSITQVRSRCRRISRKHKLALIVVDYLQLLTAPGEKRYMQIDEISRGCKALAKELNVPLIALCQLNRGVESRDDKRPRMSDLREAGGIEQDADLIAYVYRHEYYNRDTDAHRGIAEIGILKQRNGPLGRIELNFEGQFQRFTDYIGPNFAAREREHAPAEKPRSRRGFAGRDSLAEHL